MASTAESASIDRPQLDLPSHEAIALRAYELFLERGAAPGNDIDDWLRAERELGGSAAEADRLTRNLVSKSAN